VRALVQRVTSASVRVADQSVGVINAGCLVLLGITQEDDDAVADAMARKVVGLRIFNDKHGQMNLDLEAIEGSVLCISQFTLYGSLRRGRRPSFMEAAEPGHAKVLYERFCAAIEKEGVACERGQFGTHMEVKSVNDGPVTFLIDSAELERPRRT